MLLRDDLSKFVLSHNGVEALVHWKRAVDIRLEFQGVKHSLCKESEVILPGCHIIAHAYARAFDGVSAVDGEKLVITSRTKRWFSNKPIITTSSYTHSWNVIHTDVDVSFILDIYPDEGCPMMPVLLSNPHPAYLVPEDELPQKEISKRLAEPACREELLLTTKHFKEIAESN